VHKAALGSVITANSALVGVIGAQKEIAPAAERVQVIT